MPSSLNSLTHSRWLALPAFCLQLSSHGIVLSWGEKIIFIIFLSFRTVLYIYMLERFSYSSLLQCSSWPLKRAEICMESTEVYIPICGSVHFFLMSTIVYSMFLSILLMVILVKYVTWSLCFLDTVITSCSDLSGDCGGLLTNPFQKRSWKGG